MHRLKSRRIVVLSLQGDTLLVYTNPVEGLAFCGAPCCFDGKLLVRLQDEKLETVGVLALRGG